MENILFPSLRSSKLVYKGSLDGKQPKYPLTEKWFIHHMAIQHCENNETSLWTDHFLEWSPRYIRKEYNTQDKNDNTLPFV